MYNSIVLLFSLIIISISQALFLGIILLFFSKKYRKGSVILGVALLFIAYDLYEAYCYYYGDLTPWLPDLSAPLLFLYGPIFFLLILELSGKAFSWINQSIVLGIFFILGIVTGLVSSDILYTLGYIQVFSYLLYILYRVRKNRRFIIPVVLLNVLTAIAVVVSIISKYRLPSEWLIAAMLILYIFIIFWLTLLIVKDSSYIKPPKAKYAKFRNGEKNDKKRFNHLLNFMDREKPYLNPEVSQKSLAESMGLSSHYLSYLINEFQMCNFQTFINRYRVNKAKELLKNGKDATILEILYDSGFNSKSTFNKIFKDITGFTPSQYKNSPEL